MSETGSPSAPTLTRVCRKCSTQSTAEGDYCPRCGYPFAGRRRPSRKAVMITAVALLLALGGSGAAIAKSRHDDAQRRAAAAAAERAQQRADAAAEKAEVEAQEAADAEERATRQEYIKALQRNITKHAKELVGKDVLDGPILRSECTATGGGSSDDLTALTGTFDCMAVTEDRPDGTMRGYGYAGTIDWTSGDLTWQLGSD